MLSDPILSDLSGQPSALHFPQTIRTIRSKGQLNGKCACSATGFRAAGNEIIGIDLGTTNSCVAVMEGKVRPTGHEPW